MARSQFEAQGAFSGGSFVGANPQYQEMAARFDATAYAGGTSEQAAANASRAWSPPAPGNAIKGAGLLGFTRSLIPSGRPFDAMDNTIWINSTVGASWGEDLDFSSREVACFGFEDDLSHPFAPRTVCEESFAGDEACSLHIYSAEDRSCNDICADNPGGERTCVQARFFAAGEPDAVCTLGSLGDDEEDGCDMLFGPNTSGTCTCSGARYSVNLNGYYVIAGARVEVEKWAILDFFQLVKGFAQPPAGQPASTEQRQALIFEDNIDSGFDTAAFQAADAGAQEGLSKAESLANAGQLLLLHLTGPGEVLQTATEVMIGQGFIADRVEQEAAMLLLSQRVLAETSAGTRAVFRSELLKPLEGNTAAQESAWTTLPWPVAAGRPLDEIAQGIVDGVSSVTTDQTVIRGAAYTSVLKSGGTAEDAAAVTAYITGPTSDAMCQDLAHLLFAYGRSVDEAKEQILAAVDVSGSVCDVSTVVDAVSQQTNVARLLTSPALDITATDSAWHSDQVQTPAPTIAYDGIRRLAGAPTPSFAPTAVNGSGGIDASWATQYQASLVRAIAEVVELSPTQVVIEDIRSTGRRLDSLIDSHQSVARMLGTSDGFAVDFVVTPYGTVSAQEFADIAARVEALEDTSSSSWSTFITTLNDELVGDPASQAALVDALVTIPGGTSTEAYTYVSTPGWTTSAWSACSETCGDGIQTRTIGCSLAWDYAACFVLGDEPESTQDCTNYDGCPFYPLCPLGKGQSLACGQQLGILIGIFAFIALLILLRFLLYLRRKLRPPKGGRLRLGELNNSVAWAIVDDKGKEHVALEESSGSRRAKMHIVWDITLAQVQEWVGSDEPSAKDTYDELADDAEQAPATARLVANRLKPPEVVTADLLLQDTDKYFDALPDGSHVFVHTGDGVEYFSDRHKTWLAASVRVKMKPGSSDAPEAQYDLKLGLTAQPRLAVPLSSMRPPLRRGEPCFFFVDDKWLPAIVTAKDAKSSIIGYTIHIVDHKLDVPCIQANRLKRRYPSGSRVEIYRGLDEGWLPAVVQAELRPDDGEDVATREPTATMGAAGSKAIHQQGIVFNLGKQHRLGYHEAPRYSDGRDVHYWSTVVVHQEAQAPAEERVQSHLVRFQESYMEELINKMPASKEPIAIEDQVALVEAAERKEHPGRDFLSLICSTDAARVCSIDAPRQDVSEAILPDAPGSSQNEEVTQEVIHVELPPVQTRQKSQLAL